jgi:hypothetical protein
MLFWFSVLFFWLRLPHDLVHLLHHILGQLMLQPPFPAVFAICLTCFPEERTILAYGASVEAMCVRTKF